MGARLAQTQMFATPSVCCLQKEDRAYYYLWQLYHLSQDEDTARAQLAEAQVGCRHWLWEGGLG
jgi:hypothetical protein